MNEIYYTKNPYHKKHLKCFEIIEQNNKYVLKKFEKTIYYVEESESTIELYYKNKLIESYGKRNDYYGFLTSIKSAIAEAKSLEKKLKINPKDNIVFKVFTTIELIPFDSIINENENTITKKFKYLNNSNLYIDCKKSQELFIKRENSKINSEEWVNYNIQLSKYRINTKTTMKNKEQYRTK